VACAGLLGGCAGTPPTRDEMFVTRSSAKSPADLQQAIRDYVQEKNWQYTPTRASSRRPRSSR
jgi:hypothetical protein